MKPPQPVKRYINVKVLSLLLILLHSTEVRSQGWIQEGAYLQNEGGYIVVEGSNGHFTAKGDASVGMTAGAQIQVQGNWVNNSSGVLFRNNLGTVLLNGGNQRIQGSALTGFPTLETGGSGIKILDVDALVGGAFGRGNGQLILSNANVLELNSNRLIINNPSPTAIPLFAGRGYILGETAFVPGYGEVQWNVRDAASPASYTIPLGGNLYFRFDVNNAGTQNADSGFVRVATYPTNNTLDPNNRPFPSGVTHTNNEYGVENSLAMTDRFWILSSGGYSTDPDLDVYFKYDGDNAGQNSIFLSDLGALRWDGGISGWQYPVKGSSVPASEYVLLSNGRDFNGIWTLSDTTPCPEALFSSFGNCVDAEIRFVDGSTIAKGGIRNRSWDFDNGVPGSDSVELTRFTTSGNFDVKLIVEGSSGCLDSIVIPTPIDPAPIADFSYTDTCANNSTTFVFTGSAPGSSVVDHYWEFPDGTGSTSSTTSKSFGTPGLQTVLLSVTNTEGCVDSIDRQIQILEPPTAAFTVDDACEGDSSIFRNSSTAGSGLIDRYEWDFGVSGPRTSADVSILFPASGSFPVQLVVENTAGCTDTMNRMALVNPRAFADFSFTPSFPTLRENIQFADLSNNATNWFWSFGDGDVSTFQSPTHRYLLAGSYPVTLIANNQFDCPDTTLRSIQINGVPMFWIPTAFTPDRRDDLNGTFGLNTPVEVGEYKLEIFSRWGEKIFESNDFNIRWDGTYRGTDVQQGSYLYTLTFRDPSFRAFHYSGEILLLR
ncbi:MAG: PKD domain-containing protein [Flavobacteriales bacterium]|nr:PKD domain-containing protein [Flavobacteriales bacterium]